MSSMLSRFRTGWPLWILLALGLCVTVTGAFIDVRIIAAGLMICFAVMPIVGFFIYAGYVFSPRMMLNIVPHVVECVDDGYCVKVFRKVERELEDGIETEWLNDEIIHIPESCVTREDIFDGFRLVSMKDAPVSVLFVPLSRFPENVI